MIDHNGRIKFELTTINPYHFPSGTSRPTKNRQQPSPSGVRLTLLIRKRKQKLSNQERRLYYYVIVGGGVRIFQATENATKTQNTTLKTYGKLSFFVFYIISTFGIKRCKFLCFMKHFYRSLESSRERALRNTVNDMS